jgi:AcrR family transcriptional regulator
MTTAAGRSQQARSAETQGAVLDATIRCLIELGYAATTTNAIQQRAGCSRGAMTHQFASKHALLIAAVQHLADVRAQELAATAAALPPGPDRTTSAIASMWATFKGDLFYAALELWNAARTNPDLHKALYEAERKLGRQLFDLAAELFGDDVAARPTFPSALDNLLALMRGSALTRILRGEFDDEQRVIAEWAAMFTASITGNSL